jgi:hypothetical protein
MITSPFSSHSLGEKSHDAVAVIPGRQLQTKLPYGWFSSTHGTSANWLQYAPLMVANCTTTSMGNSPFGDLQS